jgi:hypothetical protein
MKNRLSVAEAVRRKMAEPPPSATPEEKALPASPKTASTRIAQKFITFPVSTEAKRQFDMLAVETGTTREELMREALKDLFLKRGKAPIT